MRKYRFIWLALIPIGAVGALATGMMPVPWQSSEKPAAKAPEAREEPAKQAAVQTDSTPTQPKDTAAKAKPPTFGIDIARIDNAGSSVIAGFATPGVPVTIMADGVPIGVVTPDANGEWVLVTAHKFANLDPNLTIVPGARMPKVVASATNAAPEPAKLGRDDEAAKPIRTAAAVTDQMLTNLKKLTDDAKTDLVPAQQPEQAGIKTGSVPDTSIKQQVAAVTPPPSASAAKPGVPVPVQFVYREAALTEKGREAAKLLLAYFKAKQFKSVVLSGHADERGSASANKALSKQRLLRIKKLLRTGGYAGRLKLVPMGETQKYTGIDRSKFEAEELYQLDRRVEVMSAE
ncbi:MAG: OmpA family protein [Hyphomicrobiaceae bacterium]